jgi:hypothetical protein
LLGNERRHDDVHRFHASHRAAPARQSVRVNISRNLTSRPATGRSTAIVSCADHVAQGLYGWRAPLTWHGSLRHDRPWGPRPIAPRRQVPSLSNTAATPNGSWRATCCPIKGFGRRERGVSGQLHDAWVAVFEWRAGPPTACG